ncbi:Appr-1-p processing domain protein [Caldicellulosiruptor acetigenus I77R1B]|uniref:Appr-1-p processing domain protein n=1 Tax=Caldicellulosiruptor acetigenus (strain ATCC 700853 / DSM 12137 / I77R1B) TaxID=632335 RepID=E4S800_CALA7|nr:macro domain-containing protein [Caldicellulosiruptor acetigenus]ADQ41900.1 Appr-1-p processing domain protein [Caldicellulosiruptor acetigenus I77R1B]
MPAKEILQKIIIKKGDITKEQVDAIVNAANSHLKHGGGVALAIVKAGGQEIQKESDEIIKKIGFLPTGNAVITNAYRLPCKFVIHTVGPIYGEGNEDEKLSRAIYNSLYLAHLYNLKSIALPAVSSGIFGFPKDRCAKILIDTAVDFLSSINTSIEKVIFCLFDDETFNYFLSYYNSKFSR